MEILFVPGLLSTPQVWGSLNDLRKSYRCHDADVTQYDDIERMADSICDQFKNETAEKIVIGFSMGGYIALELVLKAKLNIKGLILMNTTAAPVNPLTIPDRMRAIELAKTGKFNQALAYSYDLCFYKHQKEWEDLLNIMGETVGIDAYVRQQNAIMTRKSLIKDIETIDIKTLIVSARYDKIVPYQDAMMMFDKIKHSSLAIIDDCGHIPMIEQPAIIKRHVITYLNDMKEKQV
jgi:pimeloyl-ACP methyl ester carboxylesterase